MPAPFHRLSIAEFALLLERFPFKRRITSVHLHHTWRPNHRQFRGHESIVSMWRHHTVERGFSDIAQHLTVDPEGLVWTGRSWDAAPASARGYNGNSSSGPFMIETVGDFDHGMDRLDGAQLKAVLDVIRLVQRRFDLAVDALMFHNQMAVKSCPGSAIDQQEFQRTLAAHEVDLPPVGQRGTSSGPFGGNALASMDAVLRAIEHLRGDGAARAGGEDADAGADCGIGDPGEGARGESARGDPELGPAEIEELGPHVVNLRLGRFSDEGAMTTSEADVRALFGDHLARWVEAYRGRDRKARILFFAHGGLVSEKAGLGGALRAKAWWLANDVYPIFFVWETGLFQTLGDLLAKIRHRASGARDLFDWTTDPLIEEAARALQADHIWDQMKVSASRASADGGGAHFVATALKAFMDKHGGAVELHAIGHSAGSIFHGHFLPACRRQGVHFASLQLLAPAISCSAFKTYLEAMKEDGGKPPFTTMFTMSRTWERKDHCARVYRKSLLYLVHEACEEKRKTPILGLEDSLLRDADLSAYFGAVSPSDTAALVWSKSPLDSGRSASRSTTHGGFDDDPSTMNSALRRILGLRDDEGMTPFPSPPGGRWTDREWSDEVDWPEPFQRLVAIVPPPANVILPPAAAQPISSGGEVAVPVQAGRRLAVCIGINDYPDPRARLTGCVGDAMQWQSTLKARGFQAEIIRDQEATRERLLRELRTMVGNSRSGDVLVFQYAGHGTHVYDRDGDEAEGDTPGQDEALCPFDYASGQLLVDDDIAAEIISLPAGVQFYFLLDCCHSGTATRFGARALSGPPAGVQPRPRYLRLASDQRRTYLQNRAALRARGGRATTAAKMREVTFSACRSNEVAWEVDGQGEFTRRAHDVLARGEPGSNAQFLESVLAAFGSNARQQPRLDCDVSMRSFGWLGA